MREVRHLEVDTLHNAMYDLESIFLDRLDGAACYSVFWTTKAADHDSGDNALQQPKPRH